MIDPIHLTKYIIRPVLKDLGLYSVPAEQLVLGTACQESQCGRWLKQLGGGPGLGIYQMEPDTHDDIWDNYIEYHSDLAGKVKDLVINMEDDLANEMVGNLYYATAMCRIHYLRVPEPIPDNLAGQAAYWKQYYNSPGGKGTEWEYRRSYQQYVGSNLNMDLFV